MSQSARGLAGGSCGVGSARTDGYEPLGEAVGRQPHDLKPRNDEATLVQPRRQDGRIVGARRVVVQDAVCTAGED
eukprot:1692821-Prymnesium_polylepis.1